MELGAELPRMKLCWVSPRSLHKFWWSYPFNTIRRENEIYFCCRIFLSPFVYKSVRRFFTINFFNLSLQQLSLIYSLIKLFGLLTTVYGIKEILAHFTGKDVNKLPQINQLCIANIFNSVNLKSAEVILFNPGLTIQIA